MPNLPGRRILLGVTGGIAAYKSADLTRRLMEIGAEVQVVMSEGAKRFVGAATFQALSGKPVRDSLWDAQAEGHMGHIELARWPDLILIAPATADVIARLAQGRADDLLTTLVLASDKPVAIAPAMNRLMWAKTVTQDNLAKLAARGVHVLGPGAGFQACGEVGEGRMREPLELRDDVVRLLSAGPLRGRHAVVTAGPTREPIDPVRFITNRSSGKQGYALAMALAQLGARVTLVSGPTQLAAPPGVTRIDVESAKDMLDAALAAARDADLFVVRPRWPITGRRRSRAKRSRRRPIACRWSSRATTTSWCACAPRSRTCSWSASRPRPRSSNSTRAKSWRRRSST
jgi:phosphopantothenoylcysteine decarboxylase/phosphopantothenate--cysteine ligase